MNQKKQTYHHKNLKNTLIEKGIELVNNEGVDSFSLRKVAAACGVSHAAPYSHFQNKEELLAAMQEYITEQFCDILNNQITIYKDSSDLLEQLGIAYVSFFIDNPTYFSFLYVKSNLNIDLSILHSSKDNYKPFEIYKAVILEQLEKVNYPKSKQKDVIIALWSFIHGIASLATMDTVKYDENWIQKVTDFMRIFELSFMGR